MNVSSAMLESPHLEIARTVDAELLEAVKRLYPQLNPASKGPNEEQLREIISSPATTLLLARDVAGGGRIIGSLILITFRVGRGLKGLIEDVVVDSESRGKGVGEALSREALRIAAQRGAAMVDLTSLPVREAANRLYQRIGFKKRDTNVYRFELGTKPRE
jgi:ribosomal protein S18 acetylase RimI-like enzyme